jgi:hypothetical protein
MSKIVAGRQDKFSVQQRVFRPKAVERWTKVSPSKSDHEATIHKNLDVADILRRRAVQVNFAGGFREIIGYTKSQVGRSNNNALRQARGLLHVRQRRKSSNQKTAIFGRDIRKLTYYVGTKLRSCSPTIIGDNRPICSGTTAMLARSLSYTVQSYR